MNKYLLWVICIFAVLSFSRSCIGSNELSSSNGIEQKQSSSVEKPTANWQYSKELDLMADSNIYHAINNSENHVNLSFPYGGDTYGHLQLRKHPRYGKNIIFYIDRGQILCSAYSDCSIAIKFDKKPVITIQGNPPEDNSSEVVFLPYSRLFSSIKNSEKMLVEVKLFHEGTKTFSFNVKQLDWKN